MTTVHVEPRDVVDCLLVCFLGVVPVWEELMDKGDKRFLRFFHGHLSEVLPCLPLEVRE